jgi:hypothetical protein
LQNTPFVILKSLDVPKETLERMSFEEKYEGYVLDLVKYLSEEVISIKHLSRPQYTHLFKIYFLI